MRTDLQKILLPLSVLALLAPAGAIQAGDLEDAATAAVLRDFQRSKDRLLALAAAIPPQRYAWRPAEDVRSIAGALLHVAGGNYVFADALGVALPADLTYRRAEPGPGLVFDMETRISDKGEVIAILERSMARVEQALAGADGADPGEPVRLVSGAQLPRRDLLLLLVGHQNQHLGQVIAYARSIGVAPPWSVARSE